MVFYVSVLSVPEVCGVDCKATCIKNFSLNFVSHNKFFIPFLWSPVDVCLTELLLYFIF